MVSKRLSYLQFSTAINNTHLQQIGKYYEFEVALLTLDTCITPNREFWNAKFEASNLHPFFLWMNFLEFVFLLIFWHLSHKLFHQMLINRVRVEDSGVSAMTPENSSKIELKMKLLEAHIWTKTIKIFTGHFLI